MIVCKRCGQTKGRHSGVSKRCPIQPPYPESNQVPGIVDRFSMDDRWKQAALSIQDKDKP